MKTTSIQRKSKNYIFQWLSMALFTLIVIRITIFASLCHNQYSLQEMIALGADMAKNIEKVLKNNTETL